MDARTQAPFLPAWEIHQGKELSYTNLLDLDAALRIALEFPEPVGVVIKHTNPCGVALGATIAEAYVRAREADPLSAFGGIVGLNRTLDARDGACVDIDVHRGRDRPGCRRGGQADPGDEGEPARGDRRFREARQRSTASSREMRGSFLGGMLMQDRDVVSEARAPWPHDDFPKVVTKRAPTPEEWRRFASRGASAVTSSRTR